MNKDDMDRNREVAEAASERLVLCEGCYRAFAPRSNESICEECEGAYRCGGVVWQIWRMVPWEYDAFPDGEAGRHFTAIGNKLVEIIKTGEMVSGHEPSR